MSDLIKYGTVRRAKNEMVTIHFSDEESEGIRVESADLYANGLLRLETDEGETYYPASSYQKVDFPKRKTSGGGGRVVIA